MKLTELDKLSSTLSGTEPMPLLFLGHGSPMNALEDNEFTRSFGKIGSKIERPKAILCVSAHWETPGTFVTAMEHPPTIHDFGGFPEALYNIQYPAPGSPELANETKGLVTSKQVGLTDKWGLDHGAWSVIRHLYPDADIPVVQLSLDYRMSPKSHFELGQELGALRKKGVLIIGSGNLVHNLPRVAWDRLNEIGYGYDWAEEARTKMNDWILEGNYQPLLDYEKQGTALKLSIPSPDHFLPLLYVLALKDSRDEISLFNDKLLAGSLSMTSVYINRG
ncbi:MAG: 4,5-DOPA dioxygenase extradiol [Mangrovibacterium sp.]